jgi:curved DNA-binding protein CbpA
MPNPFDILGLATRFDLTDAEVERAYLTRAASCHPDLVGDTATDDAARLAAALNDAKAVLLDPESRARALLALLTPKGHTADERSLPDGFLLEIMETRMAVEEALASGEAAELARWREWAAEERRSYIERIGGLFTVLDNPPADEGLAQVGQQLNAWRYIERMLEQIAH